MMTKQPFKIGMVSLGCPKNQVDAEQILGVLAKRGFEITPEQTEADVIVVNTCGFIESAKEESIEAILDAARMKKQGKCRALIVAGCLAQRYRDELAKELPEADAIIGTAEIPKVAEICERVIGKHGQVVSESPPAMVCGLPRVSTTPLHYRYLKIAEGCNHPCSFCIIPRIRGSHRSRPQADVVREAQSVIDEGRPRLLRYGISDEQAWQLGLACGGSVEVFVEPVE